MRKIELGLLAAVLGLVLLAGCTDDCRPIDWAEKGDAWCDVQAGSGDCSAIVGNAELCGDEDSGDCDALSSSFDKSLSKIDETCARGAWVNQCGTLEVDGFTDLCEKKEGVAAEEEGSEERKEAKE